MKLTSADCVDQQSSVTSVVEYLSLQLHWSDTKNFAMCQVC